MTSTMTPADYDAWYDTPRGRWIGETEFSLLHRLLAPQSGESILDVGCGTGWFTRRFAAGNGWNVTGIDNDAARLDFARAHGRNERYQEGDAHALPFDDASIDCVVSVAALCFIDDWRLALSEMVRVARRRLVVGLLNRHSLLWWQKGREHGKSGGTGGYRGARWHTADEISEALKALPLTHIQIHSALFLPGASPLARACERVLPSRLPWGGFLVAAADKRNNPALLLTEPSHEIQTIRSVGHGACQPDRLSGPCRPDPKP